MRIVHTALRYPPATGGVETYVEEIVKRTYNIDEDRDVRVLTSKMRTHGPLSELAPELLLDDPIYVQRLHHMATPLISYPRLQALSYYIGHHKPDILHGYSFWYQPADVAARYAKKHHIPFIFHPIYYENDIRRKPLWQIYAHTIGSSTFAAADVVAVISPYEQKLIEKAGYPVRRFEIISPGVDMSKFAAQTENIFTQKGIHGSVILTVSRLALGKGLHDIIQALPAIRQKVSDAVLVIVGENFGAQHHLQTLTKKLNLEQHVHFLGKLDDRDLISVYQHAKVFVHPTHYEAFGIVLAEAGAAGLPVVARNTSAVPYIIQHQKTGILFNTREELTDHVVSLLKNEPLRRSMGESAKKRIESNFTWDVSIKKLLSLYEELKQ